ncbi:MAG TPA: 23S rRNA (guanosine(2251)-2'-O)-methyltransferase RlmB [Thermodesulfovibrionales bacterium]|nr:23S rRNA (guanosine(2251)-2'-O)-methyltransferase RlmB [Thermodesulfovibrionales bacterium]
MRPKFANKKIGVDSPRTEEWIYGLNPVLEAMIGGRGVKAVYLSPGRHEKIVQIKREAEVLGIPVESADSSFFDSRFPKGHQGVAARVLQRGYVDIEDLLVIPLERKEVPLFVALDLIEDPRNFGAMLRSADASGVHGVVIQSHRSATLGPEVSKSSAGAVEYVPVAVVPNIKHAIRRMKEEGITVVGAEADAHTLLWDADLTVPLCIVIGSESQGMRRTVREHCDVVAGLPMKGRINSLNASVAAGIILFEILRQRFTKKLT